MRKLTYTKIVNSAISIDLYNGYSTIAVVMANDNTEPFKVSFYLQQNNTNIIIPIDDLENVEFDTHIKKLNVEILKYVATLLSEGNFDMYIKNYNQYIVESFHEYHKTLKVGE